MKCEECVRACICVRREKSLKINGSILYKMTTHLQNIEINGVQHCWQYISLQM